MDFMAANVERDQPFFCYLPYNIPHTPFQVPDEFYDPFRDKPIEMLATNPKQEDIDRTRAALALCENIDWNVGRLLDKLDELEIAEDTIVFYFGDNGPNGARWNGGMKGTKGSTDEGGVRVAGLMRWKGHIQAGTVIEEIAGAIDLLPTLTDLAGIDLQVEKPMDGRSLKPLLLGEDAEWSDRIILSHQRAQLSARNQRFRLDTEGKLYDMVADGGQTTDVSQEHPNVHAELSDATAKFHAEVLPVHDDRPFATGYWETTRLPARDGVHHGTVQRSAGAPNCSYFTHWTQVGDRMTWEIEVGTTGDYEAAVYYTCPEEDVGSTVELAFHPAQGQTTKVQGQVTNAHDPPLIGAADDRCPRGGESYVKDFEPLTLGTIHLNAGRGTLTLRALDVPHSQVMDVRRVMLTLKE